jgi:hypothetical protein
LKRVVIILIILALIASPIAGLILYENYEVATCGIACGPSVNVPIILKATLNQSSDTGSPENCGIINNGDPQSVVCQVVTNPSTSGSIVVKLESQNGNSTVAFGDYSSSQYVQFESNYPCMYSSNLPDYNSLHCAVLTSGSTYKFNYKVLQNSSSQQEVVLTIVVTKTCCWP